MRTVLLVASYTALTLIAAAMFLMMARMILTLLAPDSDHPVSNVIFNSTDFLMSPARVLIDSTGWFADSPLDMPALITIAALSVLLFLFLMFV